MLSGYHSDSNITHDSLTLAGSGRNSHRVDLRRYLFRRPVKNAHTRHTVCHGTGPRITCSYSPMTSSASEEIASAAKAAFEASQLIPSQEHINALQAIKAELESRKDQILAANRQDLEVSPLYTMVQSFTEIR